MRNFFRDCGKAKKGKDKRKIRAKEKKITEKKEDKKNRSINSKVIMIANDDDNYSRLPRICQKKIQIDVYTRIDRRRSLHNFQSTVNNNCNVS